MSEEGWESVADLWRTSAEARNRLMAEATEAMLTEAAVGPGMRVLEIGAGTGDVAILLSQRVGAGGSVLATDGSAGMLEAAGKAVAASGASNVTLETRDASAAGLAEASFDAVVARMVLMFLDLDVALPGLRRVMRDGARFGAMVWGEMAHNPFHHVVIEAARAEGGWGEATLEVVQAHARGDMALYERALAKAGFRDVRARVVRKMRTFANVADALEKVRESPIHAAPITKLPDETRRARAWARVEKELGAFQRVGGLEVPVEWFVLGAGK